MDLRDAKDERFVFIYEHHILGLSSPARRLPRTARQIGR
jgi:hypothetical protein